MTTDLRQLGEDFTRLALAIDQRLPGYVDSYFGPDEWPVQSKEAGPLPLQTLTERADTLTKSISQADGMDSGRINHYLEIINRYKPGLSSLSSVNGRGNLTMQQKMEYDLLYAQQASFALDISLLIRTVIVVLSRRGAR